MIQILIAIFGFVAIYLTQQPRKNLQKYACIFGLISQPFFLYETWSAGQGGMFLLSVFYTYAWCLGFYTQWIRPPAPMVDERNILREKVLSLEAENLLLRQKIATIKA